MSHVPSKIVPLRPKRVSPEAGAALEVLSASCAAPWTLLSGVSRRAGVNAASLTVGALAGLVHGLSMAVARQRGPQAGLRAHRRLRALVRRLREAEMKCPGAVARPKAARSA